MRLTTEQAIDKISDIVFDDDVFSDKLREAAQVTVEYIEEQFNTIQDLKMDIIKLEKSKEKLIESNIELTEENDGLRVQVQGLEREIDMLIEREEA